MLQQVGRLSIVRVDRLHPSPLCDFGMVPDSKNRYTPLAELGRPRIMWILQQPSEKTPLQRILRLQGLPELASQLHRSTTSAGSSPPVRHVIANRYLLVDQMLPDTLVDTSGNARNYDQMILFSESLGNPSG